MIQLENISKTYRTRFGPRTVLDGVNLSVARGQRIGIIGGNGAGKSTLVRIVSGVELPSSGSIHRGMSVSWPLAFGGAFKGTLSGMDNLRFLCRIYGVDIEPVIPFVEDFSELGAYLRQPVNTYSSGMRARFAFSMSLAIEFDCYLIDEVLAVGDARFKAKCQHELFEKRRDRAIILISHSSGNIRKYCDLAYVLEQGILHDFPDTKSAYEYYGRP